MPEKPIETVVATLRQLAADAAAGRAAADVDDPSLPEPVRRARASLLEGTIRRAVADALPPALAGAGAGAAPARDPERAARLEAALAALPAIERRLGELSRQVSELGRRVEAASAAAEIAAPPPPETVSGFDDAPVAGARGAWLGLACLAVGAGVGAAVAARWDLVLALVATLAG
jgi:hypothetical protein